MTKILKILIELNNVIGRGNLAPTICYIFIISIIAAGLAYPADPPQDVKLKIMVTNSSETEEKTIPAKTYLPEGVTPEDIIDKGGFEIDYDTEKNLYFVFQKVNLKPKESVTFEVVMKNIWVIPEEEIIVLYNQVNKILEILQKSPFYNQAREFGASIISRLKKIAETQGLAGAGIKESISNYKANIIILAEVKKDVGVLEDLAIQEGGIPGEKLMGEDEEDIDIIPQEEDIGPDSRQLKTVKFRLKISNPQEEARTTAVKYYLPAEVLPEYLLDKGGLEVLYDYYKGSHYVYKDDIRLAPHEEKEFILSIKDVWRIPEERIEVLRLHAEKLMNMLKKSEYKELSASLFNKISDDLNNIEALQEKTDISVNSRIGSYRLNSQRYKDAKKELAKLERLVIQAGGSPGLVMSTVDIKRKEGGVVPAGGEPTDDESGETLHGAAKWIEMVGKSIFRGKAPSSTTTWKIIYAIVVFLGVMSVFVFVIVLAQQRVSQIDPLTGTSNRDSINERIRYIFRFSAKAQRKFSLLLMDIDNFKEINDKYGHSAGDFVLKEFVILVRKAIRQNDLLGRMGGDEFLVVLSDTEKEIAYVIAKRIRTLVTGYKLKLQDVSLQLTTSVGIVTYPDDAVTLQELLSKVDMAMYAVKNKGGNDMATV